MRAAPRFPAGGRCGIFVGMKRRLLMPIALLAGACGGSGSEAGTPPADSARVPMAEAAAAFQDDWVEIDGVLFPAAMAEAPPEVVEAYVFAAKHRDVLSYMPCYCGCENPRFAHENNYDCFVDAIDTTGPKPRVTIDPMGFG